MFQSIINQVLFPLTNFIWGLSSLIDLNIEDILMLYKGEHAYDKYRRPIHLIKLKKLNDYR